MLETRPVVSNGYISECSAQYWSNPPFQFFVVFQIMLFFSHSGAHD